MRYLLAFCKIDRFRLYGMHDTRIIAVDDPVAWASVSVSYAGDCCYATYAFTRWRHIDAAITASL